MTRDVLGIVDEAPYFVIFGNVSEDRVSDPACATMSSATLFVSTLSRP